MSEEQVKSKQQVQSQPVEVKQKKSKVGLIFGIINSILILALAGGGFYLLQEIKEEQTDQESDIQKGDQRVIEASKGLNSFQSQLATMQSQIASFNKELAGKDNHFTKTLADFSQLHTEKLNATRKGLQAEITQVKRQLGKTRGDWLIADAEYLLSIANQRLHLVGDVNTARMAFEAADQRLRESGDTAVFKVREQITKEIAALRDVKVPDIVGIHSSIQLLKGQLKKDKDTVPKLAVRLPYAGKPLTESKQVHNHDEQQEEDHGLLNSVLNQLEGYVTVKHTDQQVTHILTEEEVGFILQQLGVKLEIIKIALVQQNDVIYQASIVDAKKWVKDNFTINSQSIRFLEELGRLSTIHLRTNFPDVSQSLKMIKDITKLRIEADKQGGGK
ncbi:MAG: uroporphyrinogen-III C-methyltransferase, partial [Methylococcaceae bacterium]|nr:uroporphyrinogen-III C-methyltransferase [Methylococcaceae bacterium]